MEAVGSSRFNPIEIKGFHVRVEFKDLQEILTYDFGRVSATPDDNERIRALLYRLKIDLTHCPIYLKDELQLILLGK